MRALVTGAGGQLGRCLCSALVEAGTTVLGLGHRPSAGVDVVADVSDRGAISRAIATATPDVIVHAAAYTDVDGCQGDPRRAMAVNADGARHVADAARESGAYLIAVSTDYVFPGDGGAPYAEDAAVRPLSVYGESKLAGERAVLAVDPSFAAVRSAWLYGGPGKHFPRTVLTILRDRGGMAAVTDEVSNPTLIDDLAEAVIALVGQRGTGVFHIVNEGCASRFELAQAVALAAALSPELVRPTTTAEFLATYPLPAKRPANSSLANVRAASLGIRLRPWQDAVRAYVPRLASELGIDSSRFQIAAPEGA